MHMITESLDAVNLSWVPDQIAELKPEKKPAKGERVPPVRKKDHSSGYWPSEVPTLVFSLFFFLILFMYLFLAALGLCCCGWAFSRCGERELLLFAVCRLLTVVASLVVQHRL